MPKTSDQTTVYITRHGSSEHNLREDVFMGRWPESRLTPRGQEEAALIGRRLATGGIQQVIASSLPRTMETAQIIAREIGAVQTGNPPIHPEDAFWELSKGDWEGRMPKPMPKDVKAAEAADPFGFRYGKGGERYADVVARVGPAFDGWVSRFAGQCVLFVLHGDVIRALLYHLIRFPQERIGNFQTDPCALSQFVIRPGQTLLVTLNDASHLVR